MIGKKVKLTKIAAKWYLDNPDIYWCKDVLQNEDSFNTMMQMSISVLLGNEVYGKIRNRGASSTTYGVDFNSPFGKYFAYFDLDSGFIEK